MSNKWEVWTNKRTEDIGDLFGLFFEDINHAADGGLQLALDGAVAHTTLLVGDDALLLGLDVSHEC